jgi:hypothetical protein
LTAGRRPPPRRRSPRGGAPPVSGKSRAPGAAGRVWLGLQLLARVLKSVAGLGARLQCRPGPPIPGWHSRQLPKQSHSRTETGRGAAIPQRTSASPPNQNSCRSATVAACRSMPSSEAIAAASEAAGTASEARASFSAKPRERRRPSAASRPPPSSGKDRATWVRA